eukprot:41525-Eustigmatos_ZCMA.PRE.1
MRCFTTWRQQRSPPQGWRVSDAVLVGLMFTFVCVAARSVTRIRCLVSCWCSLGAPRRSGSA